MRFVRRKDDPFLYGWTQALSERADFFECDKTGKAVETSMEEEKVETKSVTPEKAFDKPISDMNDVEIEKYARDTFNVELDRRRNLDDLRAQVRGLSNGTLSPEDVAKGFVEPPVVDPFSEIPTMPEEFANKQEAIRWARGKGLGISFRSRDSKAKTVERIVKKLEEIRSEQS